MNEIDNYLKQVRKGMRFVSGSNKTSFCDELGAQFEHRGSLPQENPVALGKAMRQVYGIGMFYRIILIVTAFPLGVLSTPMIESWFPSVPVNLFLLLSLIWVFLAAYYGGRWSGLFTGISAAVPRVIALILFTIGLDFINTFFDSFEVSEGDIGLVLITSLLLPIVGFFAGGRIRRPD
ncbi:MAG: hypothetical protein NZ774_06700 [Candidatus Poseidoniales archaeon]|nr:hypothetical protein [Candidatus Poseidoniales archaeon]